MLEPLYWDWSPSITAIKSRRFTFTYLAQVKPQNLNKKSTNKNTAKYYAWRSLLFPSAAMDETRYSHIRTLSATIILKSLPAALQSTHTAHCSPRLSLQLIHQWKLEPAPNRYLDPHQEISCLFLLQTGKLFPLLLQERRNSFMYFPLNCHPLFHHHQS